MTVNKSQGQTFDQVGLFLPDDVFEHGQLYVGLSRVRSESGLFVQLGDDKKVVTKNVVYKSVFRYRIN